MEPTREIYGNIVAGELVYLVMIVSFGLVGLALYRHYRLWMQGRPDNRVQDLGRRLKAMLVQGLGQQNTLRELPGLLHFFVYAGFLVLFIGTLMVAVHEDLGIHFLYGNFYLFYSLTLDVFGLLCTIGIVGLTYRRYVIQPTGLDNRREDLIILVWFLAVLVSGFVVAHRGHRTTSAPRLGHLVPSGGDAGLGSRPSDDDGEPISLLASSRVVDTHVGDLWLADVHWLLEAESYDFFAAQYPPA
jgi:nitrate reductase gamma subunit